ncbi:MAG TPA: hypothetical protein VGK98_00050 [Arthrobacter sp.]|jgi:hypothetical protein|uniref:hypothetical protein n=1 Tax=Arthrobacter sp. TaxID=1667 RepID=UPI002F401C4B
MEHVLVRIAGDGRPGAVIRGGQEWTVGAEPLRWFERVSWWEAERRMPVGLSRVDVEVWRLQTRLGRNSGSALTTMEIIRDGLGGGWRLRSAVADNAAPERVIANAA